jgi:hypothetical protein
MSGSFCKTATGDFPVAALRKVSVAESEALDDLLVFLLGAFLDEVQQLAALGNHGQQSAAGREVLLVDVEVVRQMENPLGEEGHLVWGAAGVSFVELIFFQVDFFCIAHGLRGWIQRLPDRPWLVVEGAGNPSAYGFARKLPCPVDFFIFLSLVD